MVLLFCECTETKVDGNCFLRTFSFDESGFRSVLLVASWFLSEEAVTENVGDDFDSSVPRMIRLEK